MVLGSDSNLWLRTWIRVLSDFSHNLALVKHETFSIMATLSQRTFLRCFEMVRHVSQILSRSNGSLTKCAPRSIACCSLHLSAMMEVDHLRRSSTLTKELSAITL